MNILIARDIRTEVGKLYELKESYLKKLKNTFPGAVINVISPDDPKFPEILKDAEFVMTSHFQADFKTATEKLKLVHLTSAGVGQIPQKLLDLKVLITNSSGVHPVPISEHVFAYMLMFSRQFSKSYKNQILGRGWVRGFDEYNIFELSGKTICIVGLGRIGRRVAKIAKAFEMKVIGVVRSPNRKEEYVDKLIGDSKLKEVLGNADFIVNCLPLTSETTHIFDKRLFSKMKNTAYFINIGRGKTVLEDDLISALKNKQIAGAGLDVFETEPLPKSSPLWELEEVIITPHYAGRNPSYMDRVFDIFCINLKAYISNKPLPNLVDLEKGY